MKKFAFAFLVILGAPLSAMAGKVKLPFYDCKPVGYFSSTFGIPAVRLTAHQVLQEACSEGASAYAFIESVEFSQEQSEPNTLILHVLTRADAFKNVFGDWGLGWANGSHNLKLTYPTLAAAQEGKQKIESGDWRAAVVDPRSFYLSTDATEMPGSDLILSNSNKLKRN